MIYPEKNLRFLDFVKVVRIKLLERRMKKMSSTNKPFNKRSWATLPDGTHIPADKRAFNLVTDLSLPKDVEVAHDRAYQRMPNGELRRVKVIKSSTGEFVAVPERKKKDGKGNRRRVIQDACENK
jgi:hypothetical protein